MGIYAPVRTNAFENSFYFYCIKKKMTDDSLDCKRNIFPRWRNIPLRKKCQLFESSSATPELEPLKLTPELWAAARLAWERRMAFVDDGDLKSGDNCSFSRMYAGMCANRFGEGEITLEQLRRQAALGSLYPTLVASHNGNHKTLNVDANGSINAAVQPDRDALLGIRSRRIQFSDFIPRMLQRGERLSARSRICVISARRHMKLRRVQRGERRQQQCGEECKRVFHILPFLGGDFIGLAPCCLFSRFQRFPISVSDGSRR